MIQKIVYRQPHWSVKRTLVSMLPTADEILRLGHPEEALKIYLDLGQDKEVAAV